MADNLVKFKPRDNGDVLTVKPRSKCQHHSFEIDEEGRTVMCVQCNEYLDPIFVLFRLTEIYSDRDYKYDAIQKFEAKEAERRQRDYERRMAKETKRQQTFAKQLQPGSED
jgi:hypothetical protein